MLLRANAAKIKGIFTINSSTSEQNHEVMLLQNRDRNTNEVEKLPVDRLVVRQLPRSAVLFTMDSIDGYEQNSLSGGAAGENYHSFSLW